MTVSPSTLAYARMMDKQDELGHMRDEFYFPQKTTFGKKIELVDGNADPIIYLAGSAMGLQPRAVMTRTKLFLDQWASQAIHAGFTTLPDCEVPSWLKAEQEATGLMTPIVGAQENEVVLMGTLTANLHLVMATFYRPAESSDKRRTKIMIEEGVFSSDLYTVESQIKLHGLDPSSNIVEIPFDASTGLLTTETILVTIDLHAETTAVLLLSAVQFHTGQLLDMRLVTAYARERGIVIGWDLAHAVGNVELKLHDWDVDFAVWCSYKYLNAGPGATAGAFIHERHAKAETPRLAGWWGAPVPQRFALARTFAPADGARGFQLSSPSILDITALTAALSVFAESDMQTIVFRSKQLTSYLEALMDDLVRHWARNNDSEAHPCTMLTPRDSLKRGAMLSLRWHNIAMLERIVQRLQKVHVVVDIRKPDIMRITPSPLYTSYVDVWWFCDKLKEALSQEVTSEVV